MKHENCNFFLETEDTITRIISERLTNRDPFSLIRLGDGEGVLMSILPTSPQEDLDYLSKHLGPEGVALEHLLAFKNRLIDSIHQADVIGVRDDIINVKFGSSSMELPEKKFVVAFHSAFKMRPAEANLAYPGCRRIALLHQSLANIELPERRRFCSAWVHYDLHLSGAIFALLRRQHRIGLISTRSTLPTLLERLMDISVKYFEIPDMYCDLNVPMDGQEYVERMEHILSQQLIDFPGMFFLVGGGLYGKLYCQEVRAQGGVAADVGSLLDAWVGIASRPTVYHSLSGASTDRPGVPPELLLTADNLMRLR